MTAAKSLHLGTAIAALALGMGSGAWYGLSKKGSASTISSTLFDVRPTSSVTTATNISHFNQGSSNLFMVTHDIWGSSDILIMVLLWMMIAVTVIIHFTLFALNKLREASMDNQSNWIRWLELSLISISIIGVLGWCIGIKGFDVWVTIVLLSSIAPMMLFMAERLRKDSTNTKLALVVAGLLEFIVWGLLIKQFIFTLTETSKVDRNTWILMIGVFLLAMFKNVILWLDITGVIQNFALVDAMYMFTFLVIEIVMTILVTSTLTGNSPAFGNS